MASKIAETAKALSTLTSITARVYRNDSRVSYFPSDSDLEAVNDSFGPYLKELDKFRTPAGCLTTPHGFSFGFVKDSDEILVLGPVKDTATPKEELDEIASHIDPSGKHKRKVLQALKNCPKLPYSSLLPLIVQAYSLLNFDKETDGMKSRILPPLYDLMFYTGSVSDLKGSYRTLEAEFERLIQTGDVNGIRNWFGMNPRAHYIAEITGNRLQDTKYCFAMMVSMYARYASLGGLDRGYTVQLMLDALRAADNMDNEDDILQLQTDLVIRYTEDVAENNKMHMSRLVKKTAQIIERDLMKPLKVEDIADELSVSRVYLSEHFRSETGYTVKEYITIMKIREAKNLLRYSEKPIIEISEALGFSSQSHFNRVFKSNTGVTPREYREYKENA